MSLTPVLQTPVLQRIANSPPPEGYFINRVKFLGGGMIRVQYRYVK
jgi:hypothetical protein